MDIRTSRETPDKTPILNPRSLAKVAGHPIHPMLVPFPIAFFIATFGCDIGYAMMGDKGWVMASEWLLGAGLIFAGLAIIAGLIDFLGDRRIRNLRAVWIHAIGNAIALILSLINVFVHSRDGYTSVVPTGLILSVLVVLILLVTGWQGWSMVYRHRVGVRDLAP